MASIKCEALTPPPQQRDALLLEDMDYIQEIPAELLANPFEYFFAGNFRHRVVLALLNRLAVSAAGWESMAKEVARYLRNDFSLHIQDEEEDFFPILRRKCLPEDDIERLLTRLVAEHEGHGALARRIGAGLEKHLQLKQSPRTNLPLSRTIYMFVRREQHHLAIGSCALFPLARLRLSVEDLLAVSEGMMARRGICARSEAATVSR